MKKINKIFSIMFLFMTFLISLFSFNIGFADKKDKSNDMRDQSNYYKWTQGGRDMPWVKAKGGPWPNDVNYYCYITSTAIQAARAGLVKLPNGKNLDPQGLNDYYVGLGNPDGYGGIPIKNAVGDDGKKYTFAPESAYPSGDCRTTPKYPGGKSAAIKKIKQFQKAGKFPIIHVSNNTGYDLDGQPNNDTHYMAVRNVTKDNGSDLTLYDPARSQTYSTMKQMGGKEKLLNGIAQDITGWGSGPKKFDKAGMEPASLTDQKDTKAEKSDGETDGKSNGESKGNGGGVPKIKPIFNPFRQKAPDNTYIGYDTEGNEKSYKRSRIVNMINIYLPKILAFIRILTYMIMYGFIAYAILSLLIFTADVFLGGLIQNACDKIPHDSFFRKFFFPGDGSDFMGFNASRGWSINILMSHIKMLVIIVLICGLISTNSLSYILGTIFYKLGNWLTF